MHVMVRVGSLGPVYASATAGSTSAERRSVAASVPHGLSIRTSARTRRTGVGTASHHTTAAEETAVNRSIEFRDEDL